MSNEEIIVRKEVDDNGLDDFYEVKVTKYGDHLDLMASTNSFRKRKPNCKKISKERYINTVTNKEIIAKGYSNRSENFQYLKKSADNLYKLIHSNFYHNRGFHCVLTYSNPMHDTKTVYHDFKIFWQKLKYHYPNMGYISVLEPTQKGAWHIHLLLKDVVNKKMFISYYDIREFWKQGICHIEPMRKGVDYGQYFRKKITPNSDLLHLYQSGVRYYRYSRNMKKPVSFTAKRTEVMDKLVTKGGYELKEQYSLSVNKVSFDGESTISKIYYKKFKK